MGGIAPSGEGNQGMLLKRHGGLDIGNQTIFGDIIGRSGLGARSGKHG